MKRLTGLIATSVLIWSTAQPALSQEICPADGPSSPAELHRSWILEGWDRQKGDPPFVFSKKLGAYYELHAPGVFYDDLAPGAATARSPSEYGALWEGPFNHMLSARHGIADAPQAIVGKDVASSTLEFVGRLEGSDGQITAIRTRSQLGWECAGGRWVIRHEHNSSRIVPEHEIAEFLEGENQSMRATDHSFVGMWVTADGRVRQELKPNGRYDEARGDRQSAYQGRYEVQGNKIRYWDDTGFTADGVFIDGILHHGGMVMYREEHAQ